jgi:hypothetical protein
MKKLKFLIFVCLLIIFCMPLVSQAQSRFGPLTEGAVIIKLFHKGKETTVRSIPRGKVQEYSLVMAARAYSNTQNNFWVGGFLYNTNQDGVLFARENLTPGQTIDKEHKFTAGTAPAGTVKYTVYNCSQTNVDLCPQESLTLTFTDGTTPDPGTKPGDTTGTGSGTGDTTGTGTLPAKIDSGVDIQSETNFDEVLGTLFNPLNYDRPENILVRIINIMLMLAGILAVLFIIIGGFLMVTSAGNETRLRQGKQTLIWAVAGLILTLLSFSIVAIVQSILS